MQSKFQTSIATPALLELPEDLSKVTTTDLKDIYLKTLSQTGTATTNHATVTVGNVQAHKRNIVPAFLRSTTTWRIPTEHDGFEEHTVNGTKMEACEQILPKLLQHSLSTQFPHHVDFPGQPTREDIGRDNLIEKIVNTHINKMSL